MMNSSVVMGFTILILGFASASNEITFSEVKDWRKKSSTILLSYKSNVLEEDNFAHGICDDYGKEIICQLHMEFPRFFGPRRSCSTKLIMQDEKSIYPRYLDVINSSIILSWIDGEDRDLLTVRVIDMNENCKEHDWQQKIRMKSTHFIVSFSDRFDVFYVPNKSEDGKHAKQSFYQNGTKLLDLKPFFETSNVDEREKYQDFDPDPFAGGGSRIMPVSTSDSSRGYFFVTADEQKLRVLDSEGYPIGNGILQYPWSYPRSSFGRGSLLSYFINKNDNSYTLFEIDSSMDKHFYRSYRIDEATEFTDIFSIAPRIALVILCHLNCLGIESTIPNACFAKKIHDHGESTQLTFIGVFLMNTGTKFYLSFVEDHYCFNAVNYDNTGSVQYLRTNCVAMDRMSLPSEQNNERINCCVTHPPESEQIG